jgi:hypothetical protein
MIVSMAGVVAAGGFGFGFCAILWLEAFWRGSLKLA